MGTEEICCHDIHQSPNPLWRWGKKYFLKYWHKSIKPDIVLTWQPLMLLGPADLNTLYSCWIRRDQLDVTCFFISLFNAQHVSDVNATIPRSLQLICWVVSWVVLLWFDACLCYVVVWLGWCGIRMQASGWALNNEIKKQVTSSWSLFIQLSR